MAYILVKSGVDAGKAYPLLGGRLLIGRDPSSDIVLDPECAASRQHAAVFPLEGRWRVEDLGSLNGTRLNGGRIRDAALNPGDQITIGDAVFLFDEGDPPSDGAVSVVEPRSEPRSPEEVEIQRVVLQMSERTRRIENEIAKVIIGQKEIILQLLTALVSGGHVLMIGLPGLAKTLMISTIARILDLRFRRVQFTPDLMPSDITGTDVLEVDERRGQKEYRFIRGPIFTNILLADEINRTPPKTQSALLEAMQEHHVTAAGTTYPLDPPFFVLATQNPLEQEGTYPLPEAQLDRFMFSVYIDYPGEEEEERIARATTGHRELAMEKVLDAEEILQLQAVVRGMRVSDHVVKYATRLARASRPGDARAPDFIKRWIHCGAGPRATQCLIIAAKARAVIQGRLNVTAADVRAGARPVLRHRIFTNFTADSEGVTTDDIVKKLVDAVPEPGERDY